jgi:uncharacterized protein (DUF697 family)
MTIKEKNNDSSPSLEEGDLEKTTSGTSSDNLVLSKKIAKKHIISAMAVGLVPVPLVDVFGTAGIQLNMIRKISNVYGVSFSDDRGKAILSSLAGGILPISTASLTLSLLKFIPAVGHVTAGLAMPIISGATTYAVYKVFVMHYESGGTLLNFDSEKMKSYFSEQFEIGKGVVADLQGQKATGKA